MPDDQRGPLLADLADLSDMDAGHSSHPSKKISPAGKRPAPRPHHHSRVHRLYFGDTHHEYTDEELA